MARRELQPSPLPDNEHGDNGGGGELPELMGVMLGVGSINLQNYPRSTEVFLSGL